MRPKVNSGCSTSQSGKCSFSDAIKPATEPISSHAMAPNMKVRKAVRDDRSSAASSSAEIDEAAPCAAVPVISV